MAGPVVHFEIVSKDAKASHAFYKTVFGWSVDAAALWSTGSWRRQATE